MITKQARPPTSIPGKSIRNIDKQPSRKCPHCNKQYSEVTIEKVNGVSRIKCPICKKEIKSTQDNR